MRDDPLDLLRCVQAGCEGRLDTSQVGEPHRAQRWHGLLGCRRCGAAYPVLAGVPVMVPEPPRWMSAHREAVLATLAANGEASREAVALVEAMANAYGRAERAHFDEDWTEHDLKTRWPLPPEAATFGGHAFRTFLGEADKRRPEDLLASWASLDRRGKPAWAMDLGCGVGLTARALAREVKHLIVADQSLRAVLSARETAGGTATGVHGLLLDASQLPLRRGCLDVLLAAQLIDLVEHPQQLLGECHRALKGRGTLMLATPAPELVEGDDSPLAEWLATGGFEVRRRDTVPWVRAHHARHFQVYFSEVLLCRKA